jgi:two-component system, OmpR family, sensor histidine kinase KdpD
MREPVPETEAHKSQLSSGVRKVVAGLRAAARSSSPSGASADAAREMSSLYTLTHRTLQLDLHTEPGPRLVELICETFALEAVAIFDSDLHATYQSGPWGIDPGELAQNAYHFETNSDDEATGICRRVLRLGSMPIGSLVLRGETSPLLNDAIADIVAITFDRYRATANESRIEAEREAEQMRAAVLDGLAHAYKTPLTAIRAAASGLEEMKPLTPAQADLVALIDEQAQSLSDLTTRLLTTARLASTGADGGQAFSLQVATVSAATLLEEAAGLVASRAGDLRVEQKEEFTLLCDARMISMLLAQYAENAAKYADPGTAITLRAERSADEAIFSVHNFGPVIAQADRERVFDRFYRSASGTARAAGTGIGLSVAKRVALAHGGSVWVASDEREGTTFFAAIPLAPTRDRITASTVVKQAAQQHKRSSAA